MCHKPFELKHVAVNEMMKFPPLKVDNLNWLVLKDGIDGTALVLMKSGNNRIQDPTSRRRRSANSSENCTDNPPRLPVFPIILFKSSNFLFSFYTFTSVFFGGSRKVYDAIQVWADSHCNLLLLFVFFTWTFWMYFCRFKLNRFLGWFGTRRVPGEIALRF